MRDRAQETVAGLRAWLPGVVDPLLQAGALFALRRQWTGDPEAADFFASWLRAPVHWPAPHPLAAYQAAAGWIERSDLPPPSAALNALRAAYQALQTEESIKYQHLPFWMFPDNEKSALVQSLVADRNQT